MRKYFIWCCLEVSHDTWDGSANKLWRGSMHNMLCILQLQGVTGKNDLHRD